MGVITSLPLALGGGVLGITTSLLLVTIMLALWALVLLILHPLHATIFIISSIMEYFIIEYFGFDLWTDLILFFVFYVVSFAIYTLGIRRILPLPQTDIEQLIKLSELKKSELLTDEEYSKAKKRILKL